MNTKKKNILELTLQFLKVKFTKPYAGKLYNEFPYEYKIEDIVYFTELKI